MKRLIKCGKSAGEDGIMPKVIIYILIDDILLDIISKYYINSEQPDLWNISNIVPVHTSGDITKADNYRRLSLTSVMAKTYTRMIINRIRPVLDPLLRSFTIQNGFRKKKSTVGQILPIRRILGRITNKNLLAVLTCIYFKKAFDYIHRGKMAKVIRSYGIPDKLVKGGCARSSKQCYFSSI